MIPTPLFTNDYPCTCDPGFGLIDDNCPLHGTEPIQITNERNITMTGHEKVGLMTKEKVLARDLDFYRRIGAMGGKTPRSKPTGFAAMSRAKMLAAASKGGRNRNKRRNQNA